MKLVELKLKYRSINKYKVLSHFLVKEGLSKEVVKIPARRLSCEIYMAWYFLKSSIANISPHYLIDQLTTGRVSDRIGRSNLQGGAHWKLIMMSRFGRLVSRMVACAYDWGRWKEGFSY
jgi:hypothetical protein